MKAMTYIKKITSENTCSIATAEKITEALHRENVLHEDLALRFRPLFGDFDFVPSSWLTGHSNQNIEAYYDGTFKNPLEIISKAREANKKYSEYTNSK